MLLFDQRQVIQYKSQVRTHFAIGFIGLGALDRIDDRQVLPNESLFRKGAQTQIPDPIHLDLYTLDDLPDVNSSGRDDQGFVKLLVEFQKVEYSTHGDSRLCSQLRAKLCDKFRIR